MEWQVTPDRVKNGPHTRGLLVLRPWHDGWDLSKAIVCVCAKLLQSCLTLRDPVTVACQAPLPMDFCRQESWSGLPRPPPGHLASPGTEPGSSMSPALAGRFFTTSAIWEAPSDCVHAIKSHKTGLVSSENFH